MPFIFVPSRTSAMTKHHGYNLQKKHHEIQRVICNQLIRPRGMQPNLCQNQTRRRESMLSSALKRKTARLISRHFPRLWMERELRFRPNHFEAELWLVPIFCDKEKTAIDVGANTGSYSYFMAKFSKNVVAFESNIELWPALRRFLGRDFRLEATALSDESAESTICRPSCRG